MTILELFILGVGLSMDAFAVSICKGLSMGQMKWSHGILCGLWFGGFQALMPLIGYLLGTGFRDIIQQVDHWVAFILLVLIGLSMIKESREKEVEGNPDVSLRVMLPLAIATSIDALAVGVTFAFLEVTILPAIAIIGATTFLFGVCGVKIGNLFGSRYKSTAELIGGLILVLLGLKILLEHLGVLTF